MNEDIKKRWIEALESGRYEKGRSQLRNKDKYCCLGVLCDILAPSGWDGNTHLGSSVFPLSIVLNSADLDYCACNDLASINDASPTFGPVIKELNANH